MTRFAPFMLGVVEQEQRRGDAVGGGRNPAARALRARAIDGGGVAGPGRAVADQSGMDGVDADRRDLERQRAHHRRHRAVDRGDGGRAGIGPLARLAAEQHHRRFRRQPRQQRVDDLDIADQLDRREADRPGDVVVLDAVAVALDGGNDEMVDRPDAGELAGDRLRLGEIERQADRVAADLARGGLGPPRVAAGQHDLSRRAPPRPRRPRSRCRSIRRQ